MQPDVPDTWSRPAAHPGRPVRDHRPNHQYLTPRPGTLARKALVRQAAARLLAQTTIHAVTLNEASVAAGLRRGLAYYYYPDRDALLADVLIEHLAALHASVCTAFDATEEVAAPERMTALAHAFLRTVLDQRHAHLALRLNARLVSDLRRPSVIARSRQVIETLRTAWLACIPGLDAHPVATGLVMRQFLESLSAAVTWFRPDGPAESLALAQLLASQAVMAARAIVDGNWVLPAPASVPAGALADPASPAVEQARHQPVLPPGNEAIWLTPEQARRSLSRLVRAVHDGVEVVLTHRGLPSAKLVPATAERARLRGAMGAAAVSSVRRAGRAEPAGAGAAEAASP